MSVYPEGIDVSNWQGRIDWPSVAGFGIAFAAAKATEGVGFVDPTFAANWAGMKANQIARIAYHFARPDNDGPEDEAEFFCNHVDAAGLEPGDILALDLEDGTGDLADWTARFVARVKERLGFYPIVYSSPAFIDEHGLRQRVDLGRVGLWLASWGVPTPPQAPPPWDLVAFHQTSDAGQIPGVSGAVDLDVFNGPVEAIPLYGKPAPAPAPAYSVGQGILDRMAQLGDSPASDEDFSHALWTVARGQSGLRYLYLKQTGEIIVSPPAA